MINYTQNQLSREVALLLSAVANLVDLVIGDGSGTRALGLEQGGHYDQTRHPDEIEKIIKVIDGPIGGSYTIKGRPEREANWHMASGECPDCGHSMKKHTRGGGCMNTKPGSSG